MTDTTGLDPDEADLISTYDAIVGHLRDDITKARDFGVAAQLAPTSADASLCAALAWARVARDAAFMADTFVSTAFAVDSDGVCCVVIV